MIRRRMLVGLVATLLALPGATRAATLVIEFDLSASTGAVALNGGVQSVPEMSAGTLTLTLTGVDASGSPLGSSAQAILSGLSLTTTGLSTLPGVPVTDLSARSEDILTQDGTAQGAFDGMRAVFDVGRIAGLHQQSTLCQGSICAILAILDRPDRSFMNAAAFALVLTSLEVPGAAMLRGETAFPFRAGPLQAGDLLLRIRGSEVRRSIVPEPSLVGLLTLAGATIGAAALRRSRRAAQPRAQHA